MGDVYCANCREPWDTYHLRHDEIWETGLPEIMIKGWNGSLKGSENAMVRHAFEDLGWKFAGSIYAILRCPSCKSHEKWKREYGIEDTESDRINRGIREAATATLAELLGDDEDGLACELEDLGLIEHDW